MPRRASTGRYRVQAWADWSSADRTLDERFDTEAEARDAARELGEPLVDVVDTEAGRVVAHRRAVPFPGSESRFEPKDTL